MSEFSWAKKACGIFLLCAASAAALPAQTFTTLFRFDNTDGGFPDAVLVQATDGDLYGATQYGGLAGSCYSLPYSPFYCGTIFKITPGGTLTSLYQFCSQTGCPDGAYPTGLVQATSGDFYGTTYGGGVSACDGGCGTVFKITPSGTLTTLYSFCSRGCTGGGHYPTGPLVQAIDGSFYGTTHLGGTSSAGGTVFRITPDGTLTTLYNFCSQSGCADGQSPDGGLIQATDGDFYGSTSGGGVNGQGTVFKITTHGTLTTLYSFCSQSDCTDGEYPDPLVQAADGNFYGTTTYGGSRGFGTVFKISPNGTLTTLYTFCSENPCGDGGRPYGGLIQATDGDLYGTTSEGGANGGGTAFKITSNGKLTTLYSFCSQRDCADGRSPEGTLVQATDGNFYGTTYYGGADLEACAGIGCGTVFSLFVGLGPFVETQPTSGKVGAAVNILGSDLTGGTSVTFNGTPAPFTVVSGSLIHTTVPARATTGKVQVATPGGTLSSNVPFRVAP